MNNPVPPELIGEPERLVDDDVARVSTHAKSLGSEDGLTAREVKPGTLVGSIPKNEIGRMPAVTGKGHDKIEHDARPKLMVAVEDGVISMEGCEGVKASVEPVTQFNAGVGLLLSMAGYLSSNAGLSGIGVVLLTVGVGSLFVTRSATVLVSRDGRWHRLVKRTYRTSEELEEEAASSIREQ